MAKYQRPGALISLSFISFYIVLAYQNCSPGFVVSALPSGTNKYGSSDPASPAPSGSGGTTTPIGGIMPGTEETAQPPPSPVDPGTNPGKPPTPPVGPGSGPTTSSLTAKPYMGFATYYGAAYGRYYPTQEKFTALSNDMVNAGLVDAGYNIFSLEGWRFADKDASGTFLKGSARGPNGELVARPEFPDMGALARHIKSNKQIPGIYTDTGKDGCYGQYGGSGDFIRQDLSQFLSWGYEFLKLDHCGGNPNSGQLGRDGSFAEYQLWSQTINELAAKAGKPFIFNIADWNDDRTPGWGFRISQSWRTGTDIDCYFGCNAPITWQSILRNFDKNNVPPAAGPGHWNDPDYLLIGMKDQRGKAPLTRTEERSYFGMWVIQAAPLMLATVPSDLLPSTPGSAELRDIVLNREAIAVNQDPLGRQGELVREDSPGLQVYSKTQSGQGRRAVLLLNRTDSPANIYFSFQDLGLSPDGVSLRDLWLHKDLGIHLGSYVAHGVPAHGSVLLSVSGRENVPDQPYGSPWQPLTSKILGTPSAVWTQDGVLTVFGRGLDNYIWLRNNRAGRWDDTWSQLSFPALTTAPAFPTEKNPVDLSIRGEIGVVARGNQIHLTTTGADTPYATEQQIHVFHASSTDGGKTWSGFENLGGNVYGRVAPVFRDAQTLDVLGRGYGGSIWRKTYVWGHGWSEWVNLGGCARSGISAASREDGTVHLAVMGCDDHVWHGLYSGTGPLTWEAIGSLPSLGTPAISIDRVTANVNIFARSRDAHHIMRTRWNNGWSPWKSVGGCSKDGVFSVARMPNVANSTHSIDVLALGCNTKGVVSIRDSAADSAWLATMPAE